MKSKEVVLEITEAMHAEMLADGIDDESLLSVGRHVFKRVSADKVYKRSESKARINIFIDCDVLHHFRNRADQPNAAPYQTQINAELRKIMERDQAANDLKNVSSFDELLENEEFLSKLSAKLKERELQPA